MKTIKVSEASGAALDWMVGKAQGYELSLYGVDPSIRARVPGLGVHAPWEPSRYWAQGGPIIARRQIGLDQFKGQPCRAYIGTPARYEHSMFAPEGRPLVAAMRCYVASKLGDQVEVPDELV